MQSGITASAQLHDAFNVFTSDSSLFALPITISSESLTPLSSIAFTRSNFGSSLSSLAEHLQPKTPIYLVLRRSPETATDLIAITYVPSIAPVRAKTLFASTRASLVRDLGSEKFGETLFVTDAEEVLELKQWEGRAGSAEVDKNGGDTGILSTEERELQGIKRAEEEQRYGTSGRDLMGKGGSGSRLTMKISDEAVNALGQLREEGALAQIGIELSSESLELLKSQSGVLASQVQGVIPADRPSYTFYHYPETTSVVFIYTCPGSSKVKERMLYAASRSSVLEAAKNAGVEISKRLEAGGPEEFSEERLADEVGLKSISRETANIRQGFAKPKRPGRR